MKTTTTSVDWITELCAELNQIPNNLPLYTWGLELQVLPYSRPQAEWHELQEDVFSNLERSLFQRKLICKPLPIVE